MKEYIIIAGPNGAGKSTLYRLVPDYKKTEYINLDAIVKGIKASDELHRFAIASKIATERINDCFVRNESFVQESTLSGNMIAANIRRAQAAGYKIIIHFIGVDSVSICKKRIMRRAATGGHDIPEKDIERRYKRSFAAMKELISEADEVYMYDNSKLLVRVAKFVEGKLIWSCGKLPKWFRFCCADV